MTYTGFDKANKINTPNVIYGVKESYKNKI